MSRTAQSSPMPMAAFVPPLAADRRMRWMRSSSFAGMVARIRIDRHVGFASPIYPVQTEIAEVDTVAALAKDPGAPKIAVGSAIGHSESEGTTQHFSGIYRLEIIDFAFIALLRFR